MTLRERLLHWLTQGQIAVRKNHPEPLREVVSSGYLSDDLNARPRFNLGVIKAINGRVIQIATHHPNQTRGPDWTHELFIVPEGQNLVEAITAVLVMKELEK